MEKDEILELLKDKLRITLNTDRGYYSEGVKVELYLDDELISSDSVEIPIEKCSHDTRYRY